MKHLVLDSNLVAEAFAGESSLDDFYAASNSDDVALWITSSGLAALAGQVATDDPRWKSLREHVQVLSDFGHQQFDLIGRCRNFPQAQTAISAQVLHGEKRLVTHDLEFDSLGLIEAVGPDDALAWLAERANAPRTADFIDLKTQQDRIRPQLESRIYDTLAHGRYIMGPEVAELEQRLADYVGAQYCIGVASGTDALLIAMMALEIGAGDEVITTPFTFIATGEMIALLGARPVFVDIDPNTYNIDPARIAAAITPRTRAIMPVALYGQCADMDAINAVAEANGIPVIEDAAQSLGATYKGRFSGALSTIGCSSFFPSKPLGGYGDGGVCFTDDAALAKAMREIRVHGQDRRYHHPRVGINGRLDSMQAGILLAKMDVFADEVRARGRLGELFRDTLNQYGAGTLGSSNADVLSPFIAPENTSVFAQFTVQVSHRSQVQARLKENNVPTAVHYPVPLNRQPAMGQMDIRLPHAEYAAERVMSLPMHPYMTETDMAHIASVLLQRG